MGRYDLPGPKCRHASTGFVSYPPIDDPGFAASEVMVSTRVCSRPECVTDALAWVSAKTGGRFDGVHTTDAQRAAAKAGSGS